jgi:hypothetical protein
MSSAPGGRRSGCRPSRSGSAPQPIRSTCRSMRRKRDAVHTPGAKRTRISRPTSMRMVLVALRLSGFSRRARPPVARKTWPGMSGSGAARPTRTIRCRRIFSRTWLTRMGNTGGKSMCCGAARGSTINPTRVVRIAPSFPTSTSLTTGSVSPIVLLLICLHVFMSSCLYVFMSLCFYVFMGK